MAVVRRRSVGLGVALVATLAVSIGASAHSNALPLEDGVTTSDRATTTLPFRWQRTVLTRTAEAQRAQQFALAVTEFVNQKFPEISVEVYMETPGTNGKIHWFVDFESMEQLQRVMDGLAMDAEYNQMVLDIAGTFVDGDTHDTVYRNMR